MTTCYIGRLDPVHKHVFGTWTKKNDKVVSQKCKEDRRTSAVDLTSYYIVGMLRKRDRGNLC